MSIKEKIANKRVQKTICVVLLLAIALLSVFVVSKFATAPETYKSVIASIDEKKATVMSLTATAATASTVIAAIPGDVTTPIANQIMEISTYLLIVVCVLVLEKSLLTVMGYLSFNILIPIACGILGVYTFLKKEVLKRLAIKLVVFAMVIVMIIPFSLKIGDLIYEVNQSTVQQVTAEVDDSIAGEADESGSWLSGMLDKIKDGVSTAGEKAKQVLNSFIDAIAIFIITYCAIPIIVVFVVVWFVKFLFGITIPIPKKEKLKLPQKEQKKENIDDLVEV